VHATYQNSFHLSSFLFGTRRGEPGSGEVPPKFDFDPLARQLRICIITDDGREVWNGVF